MEERNDYFKYFEIISKHSHVYLDSKLERFGLNHCYRIYIKKICEKPGISRDVIKNFTHVHPSNTTRAIDYLASEGYISKVTNQDDKRICNLYPTEKLKEVYEVLVNSENEWIKKITASLKEEEKVIFFNLLNKAQASSSNIIHGGKNEN